MATEHQSSSAESLPPAGAIYGGVITPSGTMPAEAKAAADPTDATDTADGPPPGAIYGGPIQPQDDSDQYPWSKAYPFSSSDPGSRLMRSFTEGSGLPADIREWPDALKRLNYDPLTGKPAPHGHSPSILNAPTNIVKGIATGSAAASQRGLDQFNRPMTSKWGVVDKAVGGLKYIIGGLPIAGPAIVKSMEEAEKGNYAGMFGTLGSMGMQALIANPEAAATHLDAAGKYLFSKPKVQQTVLGGEALESLTHFKDLAKKETEAAYEPINKIEADPTVTVPGFRVADAFNKSLSDNMKGTDITPTPMKEIVNEGGLKSIGYMPNAQGQLREIFSKTSPDTPVTLKDLQGYYSELGKFMENGRLPGDVYRTAKQARQSVGDMISDVYKEHSTPGTTDLLNSWEDAQRLYEDYATRFLDPDSPLVKAIDTANPYNHLAAADRPAATLAHLTGDNEALARSYLNRYRHLGANDDIVTAATRLQKGMDQMRVRGLYQASGGLLLAMMLREFGVPTAANAATVATLLGSRLARGYFNTRPSLTSLLSDEIKPSTWRAFPLKGGDTNIRGNPSPFNGGGGGPVAQPPPSPSPPATIAPPNVPSQLLHGTTLDNAMDIAKNGFKPNEEGYTYFTPHRDIAESYGSMHDKPYAIMYFNAEKGMPFERDPDPEQLLGPGAVRYKGAMKPNNLSIEAYTSEGEPVDSWHSRIQSIEDLDNLVKRVSTIPSSSNLTPTETTFLSSIQDHPSMHPDLKADIAAAVESTSAELKAATTKLRESVIPTGDLKNIPIDRLKGIMDIMKYQKMGYNEATKIYDSINHPSAAKPATTPAGSDLSSQIKEFSDIIRDPNSSPEQREVARQMRAELRAKRSTANRAELEGILGDMQSKVREAADKHYQESIPIQDALEKAIDNIRKLRGEPAAPSVITPHSPSTLGPNWLQQLTDRLSAKDPVDVKYDLKQVIDVLEKRDPDYANSVVNGFATHYWVRDALKAALDSGNPSFVLARMKELQSKLGH